MYVCVEIYIYTHIYNTIYVYISINLKDVHQYHHYYIITCDFKGKIFKAHYCRPNVYYWILSVFQRDPTEELNIFKGNENKRCFGGKKLH